MLNGDGNEKGIKTDSSNSKKKNNLRVQHTFLYISFHYFCTTKTGNFRVRLYFYEGIVLCANQKFCCLCSCSFYFSLPLVFTLLTASISHFLTTAGVTTAVKFLFFCHDEIRVLCFTRSSSFSDIHVGVEIKSNVEEDSTLLFFLFKCPGGHTISCQVKP